MLYLGVDGGGSKTSFILIEQHGLIKAFHIIGTSHYCQVGIDGFRKTIQDGIKQICQQAGVSLEQISYSFLGIPAYGEIAEDTRQLQANVESIFKGRPFSCANDVEAAWAGSLACRAGINIVAGTGTIGFGKDQQGSTARSGGWGYYCGDEGSAYWLGKRLISLFGKEADGRLKKTALYNIVRDEFHLSRDLDLIDIVYHQLEMKRDRVARLSLLLYQAACQGDHLAIKVFREAAYEISLLIRALIRKLDFNQQEITLSYSGGVFKAGSFILEPLQEYLAEYLIKLTKPCLQPVTGAALYALKLSNTVNSTSNYHDIVKRLQKEEVRYSK